MRALLTMHGVKKRFGPATALDGVDLEIQAGEVHALLGENGAGKSTLMKVLAGAVVPDSGEMTLAGEPYRPKEPRDAAARGVAMIYQELNLAPHLTVAQNVVLGREPRRFGVIDVERARETTREALALLGHPDLSPERKVQGLGPGERQKVEIARALAGSARIVVMDEPTSSLSKTDAERLFEVVRRLAASGVVVIYISHFLEEVMKVADRYTVLRDGRTVASGATRDTSPRELAVHMAGRATEEIFTRAPRTLGSEILALDALAGDPLPTDVSLSVRRGEIVGIAGLLGAGRSETLRAVFGLAKVRSGRIQAGGAWDRGRPPWVRLAQGIGLLSEDRAAEGLALRMSVTDNLTLSHTERIATRGWIRRDRQRARADRWIRELRVRCSDPSAPAGTLSGGNQQKLALARLLDRDADVFLLDEPTRGVDVGSRAEIYRVVGELAARGKAILLVSSQLPELLGVCDRIAVMHRGRLSPARPAAEWTEATLLEAAATGAPS